MKQRSLGGRPSWCHLPKLGAISTLGKKSAVPDQGSAQFPKFPIRNIAALSMPHLSGVEIARRGYERRLRCRAGGTGTGRPHAARLPYEKAVAQCVKELCDLIASSILGFKLPTH